jgi:hypothetical protein
MSFFRKRHEHTIRLTYFITVMCMCSGRTDYEMGIKPASHRLERHAPACSSGAPKGAAATPSPAQETAAPSLQADHVKISLYHSRHYRPPAAKNKVPAPSYID